MKKSKVAKIPRSIIRIREKLQGLEKIAKLKKERSDMFNRILQNANEAAHKAHKEWTTAQDEHDAFYRLALSLVMDWQDRQEQAAETIARGRGR